uniref:Uncharacterized protein n=1 Tax=Setaria italica TaxID=4555 RepID=K3YP54_SETIT
MEGGFLLLQRLPHAAPRLRQRLLLRHCSSRCSSDLLGPSCAQGREGRERKFG